MSAVAVASLASTAGADGTTDVTDLTGTFTLSVPSAWTDVFSEPLAYDDGSLLPALSAAPDLTPYLKNRGDGVSLTVIRPSNLDIYTQEYMDAFIIDPTCVIATPGAESSTPAMPRALVGTWTCGGGFTLTMAWGASADGAYDVNVSALTLDPAVGAAVVTSIRHNGAGGGPATTVPIETEGLTVTDSGDPATAVVLRRPRVVGARSNVVIESTSSGSEYYVPDPGPIEDTQFSSTFRATGVYEVTAEDPDGAYSVLFTPDAITAESTSSDPATSATTDFSSIVGFPMSTWYGSDGLSFGFGPPEGVTATDEQVDRMFAIPVDGYSLPLEPVGVGATWTANVELFAHPWFFATVPATYRLDAIDGDRFSVSMSVTADASGLPGSPFSESQSGTFSRTMWLAGSLTQPGIELVIEETATLHGQFWYGTSDITWTSRRTFTETAAS